MSNRRKTKPLPEPRDGVVPRNEVYINPEVLTRAGWTGAKAREWTDWALGVLDHGCRTGEWPEGKPVLSDNPNHRGPGGERYTLLGFRP